MTTDKLVHALGGRGRHPRWRAKCPAHKSRGLTLSIYADADQPRVHCFYGCKSDDILAAVGLTWQDLAPRKEWLSPEAYRAYLLQQEEERRRLAARKAAVHVWTDRTRFWERVAALLLGALLAGEESVSRLWHAALAASRTSRERLWLAEQLLTPAASRYGLPEAQVYALEGHPDGGALWPTS